MFRKVLSATIVLAMISTTGTVAYTATDGTSNNTSTDKKNVTELQLKQESKIEVFQPQDNFITSYKNILLSGKAPEESRVIVEVYSTPNFAMGNPEDLIINNIDLDSIESIEEINDKQEILFLPPVVKEIEVGALGLFVQELELKLGLNKINIYIEGSEEDSVIKFVHVNDVSKAEELIENIDSMGFLKAFKESFKKEQFEDNSLEKEEINVENNVENNVNYSVNEDID